MKIHPTAIISEEAQIGEDVAIGPYVVVEGPVLIGARCVLQAGAVLTGRVVLGEDNRVGPGAVIGGDPQHLTFDPATPTGVLIGSRNKIREHCTINRASKPDENTVVGDDNFLMASAHLGHDTHIGNRNVLANNVMVGGHVEIADGVFLGGGSMFHQFIRVGSMVVAQGRSGFGKDVPPYTMGVGVNRLAGLNNVGLRRAGLNVAVRKEIQEAYALLFRSGLNVSQALAAAGERNWGAEAAHFFDFVRSSGKRGICGPLRHGETDSD